MAKRGEGETKFGSTYVVPDGTQIIPIRGAASQPQS